MIYNIVLVSAIYQNESAIGICMSPSSCVSLPPPTAHLPSQPTLLDCHRAPDLSSLHHTANFHWLSNFTYGHVYVSMLLSQFIPPSLYPAVYTSLFSMSSSLLCPADGFISTIFLDSVYMY